MRKKYSTMADKDEFKILGFTKREAEVLIMSLQVLRPNPSATNGCTVGSILQKRHPSTGPQFRGHGIALLEPQPQRAKESGAITNNT